MVWSLKEILYVISGWASLVVALNHLYWWQTKEYRLDRMLTWVIHDRGWKELLTLKRRMPKFTARALVIACLSAVVFLVLAFVLLPRVWWLTVVVVPFLVALSLTIGVLLSAPLVALMSQPEINRAREKVRELKPKVIAITGSFGKSSSKEFLATLLAGSYTVVKTQASENTPLGIARRINVSLKSQTNILILEMGAYKRGEISQLTDIATPDIAWITGIGPQHIGLFGSLENIKRAKYELIQALAKNGVAVLPVDDPDERELATWAEKENIKLITYSLKNKLAAFQGTVTEKTDRSFKLAVTESEKEWSVTVPLRGMHYAANILGAIAIARHLKISQDEIITRTAKLKQPPRQLTTKKLGNGVTLIDNSYNTNLQGFEASVNYLQKFPGHTFVVTPGIIELGKYSQKIHHQLGQNLQGVDRVWVTNSKHAREMNSPDNHVVGEENIERLFTEVKGTIKKGDTLLIEGRIPENLKQKLLSL